ncbi:branched-chain amino acid transport system permease protein [Rhizobium sp. SG_E_25_P2]|uniref:high-affinity branched-chain amino acid ABC transporter permease LivM n=1 Tax=Rhizobium sp. SG_E_25_P2 TaxID=2879942 RepID=UPI0024741A82|nr:high-affinity branched-chain amino acid ABC transporter permease LivM [Rhizobium sp. SG_E_25_P2]MDH6269638.1 branched-chain amino acid transport system permease protein [Rhizobium sp. SG_E_25_P2]
MQNLSTNNQAAGASLTARALRESIFAGVVAFGLFLLFIGLESTQNIHNELIIVTHWVKLAFTVGLVMVVRFAMIMYVRPWLERQKVLKDAPSFVPGAAAAKFFQVKNALAVGFFGGLVHLYGDLFGPPLVSLIAILKVVTVVYMIAWAFNQFRGFFGKYGSHVAILAVAIYPLISISLVGLQPSLKFIDNFGIQILIYVMLGWGLNIVVGLAGLLDLGYVAFYAVGAYSYALLSQHFGFSFWILLPLAGILAAFWGVILGFPVLRLKGDYLAIVTLAFGEIIRLVLINWKEVTNGSAGISGIPKASIFGIWSFDVGAANNFAKSFELPMSSVYYKIFLFYLILALCLVTAYVTIRLRRMPIGRAWEALREDEIACRSLGINTTNTKLTAFAIGAMFGGFAGSFFAVRQGFVSPESFVFLESAIILAIVVLGGMGSLVGIAVAAVAMVGGTELLRNMEFLKLIFGPEFTPELYRMLIFGLAMVVIMVWKPRGFVGSREPTAFLFERKNVSGSFTKEGHG